LSGGATALVAVKTLKPGATAQTREDFMRESELMADLRHPNIVCLIGVVTKDEPRYNYSILSFT
jgi:receptor tyrosine kinase-like orphan receptor 1